MARLEGTLYLAGVPYGAGVSLYAFDTTTTFLGAATVTGSAYVFPALPNGFVSLYVEHGVGFPDGYIHEDAGPSAAPPFLYFNAISDHVADVLIDGIPIVPTVLPWVTGAEILEHAGVPSPAPAELAAWAEACADATNSGFAWRLEGAIYAGQPAELITAARGVGVETYKRREAPFGLTGYVDLQGAAVRIARDPLEAASPILERYATRGLA